MTATRTSFAVTAIIILMKFGPPQEKRYGGNGDSSIRGMPVCRSGSYAFRKRLYGVMGDYGATTLLLCWRPCSVSNSLCPRKRLLLFEPRVVHMWRLDIEVAIAKRLRRCDPSE